VFNTRSGPKIFASNLHPTPVELHQSKATQSSLHVSEFERREDNREWGRVSEVGVCVLRNLSLWTWTRHALRSSLL